MEGKTNELERELANVRQAAVAAHIAGDKARADCLTGKAVGMKSTMEIARRASHAKDGPSAAGELEGMERVIEAMKPLPRC